MRVFHIAIEKEDDWLIAHGLEERGIVTQGRTLDEIHENVREVIALMFDEHDVQLELILPPSMQPKADVAKAG